MSNRNSIHQQAVKDIFPAASPSASARVSRPTSGTSASTPSSRNHRYHQSVRPPASDPPLSQPLCSAVIGDGQQCVRESLPTPDALRLFLENRCVSDVRPAVAAAAMTAGIGVASAAGNDEGASSARNSKPLLVLRGLAPAFVRVLLEAPLGIDAEFVEAHAARRRYRRPPPASPPPPTVGFGRVAPIAAAAAASALSAQWNYPELVSGFARAMWRGQRSIWPMGGDVQGRAAVRAVRAVSNCKDLAAVECRVSVWVAESADVLFLDKPVWEEPKAWLSKARRQRALTPLLETQEKRWSSSWAVEDEEIPSLEDALQETMSLPTNPTGSELVDMLEEAAYDKWVDFFEVLTPRRTPLFADGTSLEWRAFQALEHNLDMAQRLAHTRRHELTKSRPNWPCLLHRLRDRNALLATIPHILRRQRPRSLPTAPATSGGGGDGSSSSSSSEENQRALDRVTYLGGILLPISIVSSLLSMNQDFEPGQSHFWVFWAAAVPLTLLTFVIIYADKLRAAEVWEEVGSMGLGSSSGEQAIPEKGKRNKKRKKTHEVEEAGYPEREKWKTLAVEARTRMDRPPAVRPQAMAFAGEDVVIDINDAVLQSQPISLQPRTSHEPDEDVENCSSSPCDQHQPPADYEEEDEDEDEDEGEDDDDDNDDDDDDVDPNMYVIRPTDGTPPHAWRKKQLGWAGAAMCILRMQKPLRVKNGLPVAQGPRRDVERRLRQLRVKATAEGRRSLSF